MCATAARVATYGGRAINRPFPVCEQIVNEPAIGARAGRFLHFIHISQNFYSKS